MGVGTKPGGHIHYAANGGVVLASAAADRTHHHFADVNANSHAGACLSAEPKLQSIDHLIGGADGAVTTVVSRKPCNQRVPYKLVDIPAVLLDYLGLNAQDVLR